MRTPVQRRAAEENATAPQQAAECPPCGDAMAWPSALNASPMHTPYTPVIRSDPHLWLWCAASIALHSALLILLPGWHVPKDEPAKPPLTVEIIHPPEIIPPKPLPVQPRPVEQRKPLPKPKPVVEPRPVEKPTPEPVPQRAPILTAAPEAPPAPTAPVVAPQPEPKPAPPEPPRAAAAQAEPVTPPRVDASYYGVPTANYPPISRRSGDQGTVMVRVLVRTDGRAANPTLEKSSGFPALDRAALAAAPTWRFVPAKQGDKPIEMSYLVPVVFKLEQ